LLSLLKSVPANGHTEALAMENKLKLSDQPVSLGMARLLMGTPDVEKLMTRMMYLVRS
jgi:hypothetical protein